MVAWHRERERESGVFTIDFCTFIIEESTTCVCVCVCVSISDLSNQSFVRGRKRNASTSNHVLFFDCHHDFSHNHFFLLRLFFPFFNEKKQKKFELCSDAILCYFRKEDAQCHVTSVHSTGFSRSNANALTFIEHLMGV